MSYPFVTTVIVANGKTKSAIGDLEGNVLTSIELPSALTSTSLTFNVSGNDKGNLLPKYDRSGNLYTVTVAAGQHVDVAPADWAGIRYVQVVAGSTEAADRSIVLVGRIV